MSPGSCDTASSHAFSKALPTRRRTTCRRGTPPSRVQGSWQSSQKNARSEQTRTTPMLSASPLFALGANKTPASRQTHLCISHASTRNKSRFLPHLGVLGEPSTIRRGFPAVSPAHHTAGHGSLTPASISSLSVPSAVRKTLPRLRGLPFKSGANVCFAPRQSGPTARHGRGPRLWQGERRKHTHGACATRRGQANEDVGAGRFPTTVDVVDEHVGCKKSAADWTRWGAENNSAVYQRHHGRRGTPNRRLSRAMRARDVAPQRARCSPRTRG